MSDPTDIFGSKAWAKFLTKLLDATKSGIGAVARPWLVKRDARAYVEAAKIHALGEREVDAIMALPAAPKTPANEEIEDAIVVEWEEPAPLAERTHDRLKYQEQKRQLNTEKIVRSAAEEFDGGEVSDAPVDEDWIARFFTSAQDVSSESMQKLWARLLAGEVQHPGAFSLRTLEVVRNLSVAEASLFAKFASYSTEGRVFIDPLEEYGEISFAELLTLQDAGLVSEVQLRSQHGEPRPHEEQKKPFKGGFSFQTTALVFTKANGSGPVLSVWKLSGPGTELAPIVRNTDDHRFLHHVTNALRARGYHVEARKCTWQNGKPIISEERVDLFSPSS